MLTEQKSIIILMGVYNGERYLAQQLNSLAAQTHKNWRLIASDDGSIDGTIQILEYYQTVWGKEKLQIRHGPKAGFAENFMSMACDPAVQGDYYAFCDQDDVWLPEKLEVVLQYFESIKKPAVPHLFCGRSAYVRDNLIPYAYSPEIVFPKTFRNALVQCIAGANTMVFNQATKEMLQQIGMVPTPSHDWWLYQIVTGAGGIVHYENRPLILYRQHRDNLVGGNHSMLAKIKRIKRLFEGRFKFYSDKNIECLELGREFLNNSSVEIFSLFKIMRNAKMKDRIRLMEICGLYRQTWPGTLSLIFAAIFRKI